MQRVIFDGCMMDNRSHCREENNRKRNGVMSASASKVPRCANGNSPATMPGTYATPAIASPCPGTDLVRTCAR